MPPADRTGGSCSDGLVAGSGVHSNVAARTHSNRRVTVRRITVRRITVTVAIHWIAIAVGLRRQRAADYACGDAGADPPTQTKLLSSQRDDTGPFRPESSFRSATNPLDTIAPDTRAKRSGPHGARCSIGPTQNSQLRSSMMNRFPRIYF
jgi:hypothetical protein